MTTLPLPKSGGKILISSVRIDIIVSLMLDDALPSFHLFEEDWLKNASTNVLPDVCQFVFQVALVRDWLVFQLRFHATEEPEITRRQIQGVNWMEDSRHLFSG
jgi:hypothetical protein